MKSVILFFAILISFMMVTSTFADEWKMDVGIDLTLVAGKATVNSGVYECTSGDITTTPVNGKPVFYKVYVTQNGSNIELRTAALFPHQIQSINNVIALKLPRDQEDINARQCGRTYISSVLLGNQFSIKTSAFASNGVGFEIPAILETLSEDVPMGASNEITANNLDAATDRVKQKLIQEAKKAGFTLQWNGFGYGFRGSQLPEKLFDIDNALDFVKVANQFAPIANETIGLAYKDEPYPVR